MVGEKFMRHLRRDFYSLVEGAILGSIVGDALGVPGEFMEREELKAFPIRDMIGGGAHDQPAGTWSNDTTAAVAGALAGLWYGINDIPQTWANVTAKFNEIQTRCQKFSLVCLSPSPAPL